MEFKIKVISEDEDFALQQSQNLKDWIEDDEDLSSVRVDQEREEIREGEAGGELLSIIKVIAGAALEPLANTIQKWFEEKTRRTVTDFSLELESPSGENYTINWKNFKEGDKDVIIEVLKKFKE